LKKDTREGLCKLTEKFIDGFAYPELLEIWKQAAERRVEVEPWERFWSAVSQLDLILSVREKLGCKTEI